MNFYAVIGLVAVVGVLGGSAWFFSTSQTPPHDTSTEVAAENTPSEEPQTGEGTVQDLLNRTGSWECTVASSAGGTTTNGTAHIADGAIRGTFRSAIPQLGGMTITSNLLVREGYAYVWTSLYPQGTKVALANAPAESSENNGISLSSAVSYTCTPWVVDTSLFTLPEGISFTTHQ